jgi:hypothetical protein
MRPNTPRLTETLVPGLIRPKSRSKFKRGLQPAVDLLEKRALISSITSTDWISCVISLC